MNQDDNKFNDTTRNSKPEANTPNGKKVENKNSETLKTEKTDTKEQIGKAAVDNIKPYAEKAWSFTKDLAGFIKDKAPDFIDAAKKGLQEAKDTVEDAYDKFQKHREEKANTTTTSTTTTTTSTKPSDSASKSDSSSKQNSTDTNNKPKQ